MRFVRSFLLLASVLASSVLLGACEADPFFGEAQVLADTVTLSVPGGTSASALDFVRQAPPYTLLRRPETVQDANEWDLTLRRSGAGLVFRPFEPTGSGLRGAGIQPATQDYDALRRAPRSSGSYQYDPVPVTMGGSYIVRSRQYPGSFTGLCVKYAKMKVVAMDAAAGTVRLLVAVNEGCDDERLTDDD